MPRPLLMTIGCLGLILIIQSLVPKVEAMRKSSNIDEIILKDERTRRRKNYMLQLARNSDLSGNSDIGPEYNAEPIEPDANPEDLSALIVDYANMIRNDVILLDNSVETRTRKRGNLKAEKKQAIPDPPCSCEFTAETIYLGKDAIPRSLQSMNCSKSTQYKCLPPYKCQENKYNVTILRKRDSRYMSESPELPSDLRLRWVTEIIPISVGCTCSSEYMFKTENVPNS